MLSKEAILKIQSICKSYPGYRQQPDLQYLMSVTQEIKLFKDLCKKQGENAHISCCNYLFYEFIPANQYVFRYGDPGTKFYILLSGAVTIEIPINDSGQITFTEIMTFTSGSSFGELALENSKTRTASALCKSDSHFLILLKKDYSALIQRLVNEKKNEMVYFLQSLPLFQRLNKLSLSKLIYNIREKSYQRGQFIFYEGDPAKEIFIIHEGECKLRKNIVKPGSSCSIRKVQYTRMHTAKRICKGSIVGEDDVIRKNPHSYSCICASDFVSLYIIPAADFFIRITAEQPLKYLKQTSKEKKRFLDNWTSNRNSLDSIFVQSQPFTESKKKVAKMGLIRFDNIEKLNNAVTERRKLLSRNSPITINDSLFNQALLNQSQPIHKKTMSTSTLLIPDTRDIKTANLKRSPEPSSSRTKYRSAYRNKSISSLIDL